jgi:hypothetical protein
MRYVSSISPVTMSPDTRLVEGVTAVHAVKAVQLQEQAVPKVEQQTVHQEAAGLAELQRHREGGFVDRRKVCRRVKHQPVLEELRSGVERRHHNLLEGDIADHIDESA